MSNVSLPIRGLIFDLDGTLVDSGLNFDLMRREMDLPPGLPILEAIDGLPEPRAAVCRAILDRHERAGAARASLMPGVAKLLAELSERGLRMAIFTRNGREATQATLRQLAEEFDPIVTREDGPPKPDPTSIWRICERWSLPRQQVAVMGDYVFDIEAGRRAGVRTILYTQDRDPILACGFADADFVLRCYQEAGDFLTWLSQPT